VASTVRKIVFGVGEDHNARRMDLLRDLSSRVSSFRSAAECVTAGQRKSVQFFLRNARNWTARHRWRAFHRSSQPFGRPSECRPSCRCFWRTATRFRHAAEGYLRRAPDSTLMADAAGYSQRQRLAESRCRENRHRRHPE
jgi:hypothetical protein